MTRINEHEPRTFLNITPLTSAGITIVDLGELHEGVDVPRSLSLPPVSALRSRGTGEDRHASLPPMTPTTVSKNIASRMLDFEVEENAREVGETDGSAGDATASEGEPENSEVPLRNSEGIMIPRSSARIKKEKIKTWWFLQWNRKAIVKPPILHMSVQLELGDIFINQFYARQHNAQVLQIWLLVADGSSSHSYRWKQIGQDEKVTHPTLKKRVLSFQPNTSQITPSWVLSNTERRRKDMPRIVLG